MDKLGITGGLRYTHDEKRGRNRGFQFAPPAYNGPVQGSWQRVTYRLAADYQVTPDILTYASYSTGYKSGGVNQAINPARGNAVYDPEFVKAIEVGVKSRLFDRRLQVNTSLFRNKYDDLQFTVFGPLGPQAFNAEGATVQGIELEIQGAPTEWLQFDASGAYTDATFDTQILQGVQLGGKRVQRTPEWTANIGASILLPLGSAGDLRFRMDYSYTSSIFYTAFNRSAAFPNPAGSDLAPSYNNVDLRLFYRSPEKRWTGEIFATNVFDTAQVGNLFRGIGFTDVVGGGGPELVSYRPPRMYGVRVAFAF
jgi:iron complex outermembrane receptor protein